MSCNQHILCILLHKNHLKEVWTGLQLRAAAIHLTTSQLLCELQLPYSPSRQLSSLLPLLCPRPSQILRPQHRTIVVMVCPRCWNSFLLFKVTTTGKYPPPIGGYGEYASYGAYKHNAEPKAAPAPQSSYASYGMSKTFSTKPHKQL